MQDQNMTDRDRQQSRQDTHFVYWRSNCHQQTWQSSWWDRRTRNERTLCGIASVAVAMFLATAIALAVVGHQYQNILAQRGVAVPGAIGHLVAPLSRSPSAAGSVNSALVRADPPKAAMSNYENLCLTQGCVKAAAQIIENMDPTTNPCSDFYQFACGQWIQRQSIPDDKSSITQFSIIQDELDAKLRVIVEKPVNPKKDQPHVVNLKNLYQSCVNTSTLDRLGEEPLLKVLRELGGWPVVEGANWKGNSSFNWLQTIIAFRKLGYSHDIIFDLSVIPDFRNNTKHLIDLDQATLGLPDRTYLLKGMSDSVVKAYFKLMTEAASLLGAKNTDQTRKELEDALHFETMLANYSLPREERRNISALYNKMPLSELKKFSPTINWDLYFNSLLVDHIDDDEMINVGVPNFIAQVAKLLQTVDKRTLANYMMWRVVLQSYATLGKAWRDQLHNFNSVLTGKTRENPRWEQCMTSLTGSLGLSLSNLYVKNFFHEDSKDHALSMVKYITNEFLNIIKEVDWMDSATRLRAKNKAEAIVPYIGYPSELMNDTLLSDHYTNVSMKSDEYFKNVMQLRRWSTDYSFGQLRKPHIKGEWKKHAQVAVVNAFYNSLENCIEFPAGILQGAFFSKDRPNYLNFGAIGFVIGHEITHGFDDRGRQFDKDGNNKNWWEHETDEKFKGRAQCIIHQYGNYTVPEINMPVNGINTQGENIADNGGIKEAFRAYRQWVKDNGPEGSLPGLNYTADQLFWISAANVWCGKYRPEVMRLRTISGSHSPAPYRVIGPMSNTIEFAEQFNCPIGSPMNPKHKCTVW
ncbi:membrane metallo-endopeptidase-like 1 isoform X3 [Varroa jacobsoni]|uniref:membrane metallo-endopeptidase-like 1 isoform X3 n=1 Tax=Varroa jacobsoni TaxID=62625 RepID=UPI000BFA2E7F|nr:membrane metallo-endopeptidase-like 1 isoform X3 [Varroa jacobsoni]